MPNVATVRTIHEFERGVLESLHSHPKDAPFAQLWFVEELGAFSYLTLRQDYPTCPNVFPLQVCQEEIAAVIV